MEQNDYGLEEWRDIVMSPNEGLFSVSFYSSPIADVLREGEEGVLEADHDNECGENLMLDSERKVEACENGLVSYSAVGCDYVDVKAEGGSIAERRAAKLGFNAIKISNPQFRSSSPLPSPGVQSSYLTIPPGISPTVLLNSPMPLPNPQPSTTGTFALPPKEEGNQMLISASNAETNKVAVDLPSSMFKPEPGPGPLNCVPSVGNQVCSTGGLVPHLECNSITSRNLSMDGEYPMQIPKEATMDDPSSGLLPGRTTSCDLSMDNNANTLQSGHSDAVPNVKMQDSYIHSMGEESAIHSSLDGDQKGTYAPTSALRTAEDGYSWRKYGQKQVKGSEYPRSYYKCTHQNCPVKKKVEHSHDGQIIEIIYKGAHNHPKPQPVSKATFGSSMSYSETSDVNDASVSSVKADGGPIWRNIQSGSTDVMIGSDRRTDGLERTSSASIVTEVSDLLSTTQGKDMRVLESGGTPEFSSTLTCHEEDEDAATKRSFLLGDDDDNEPDSKRRRKEACFIETYLGSRAVREPRVVVQIESDVDILDDGYRWRKYGQKVVKGNPNPRSYYKCTNAGCNVRKHVERASHNLKCVITTYEGKHNHEVPAARNSNHANSGSGSLHPETSAQSSLVLPRHPHLQKAKTHIHDLPPHFDRKLEHSNEYLKPNFIGSLGGGTTPFYQTKFPNLPKATPYSPLGLSSHHHPAYPSGIVPPLPELSIPLPVGLTRPSSFPMVNYKHPERPVSSVLPFIGHQLEENNVRLLMAKEERGDESLYDTVMCDTDQTNPSSSSIYDHIARAFPS